jgi:hypothetical protein
VNDVTPAPSSCCTLQLYQPNGLFTLTQNGNANITNAWVVGYSGNIASTVIDYSGHSSQDCCGSFTGSSFERDIPADQQSNDIYNQWLAQKDNPQSFYLLGLTGDWRINASQLQQAVQTIGDGPAVNVQGLTPANDLEVTGDGKLKKLENSEKHVRRPLHGRVRYGKTWGLENLAAANFQ